MNDTRDMDSLMEKAPAGLHDFCEALIEKYIGKSSKILDIASGTGAMARRLAKRGYTQVTANDIDSASFAARELKFTQIDLNTLFAGAIGQEAYDAILAIEIIEHLENPLGFIRECQRILNDGGYLLITTPNILCSESLFQWLRKGCFLYFSPDWYKILRHVSILPPWLLDAKAVECGAHIVYRGFTPRLLKTGSSLSLRSGLRYAAMNCADLVLRGLGRPKEEVTGTNYVLLSRKNPAH